MHFKVPKTIRHLTALVAACLLACVQQTLAQPVGQGRAAAQSVPARAPQDAKAHAEVRAKEAKRAARKSKATKNPPSSKPERVQPRLKGAAPAGAVAGAGVAAALAVPRAQAVQSSVPAQPPSNLMPLPQVVGPLPEGNLDSRVRGNDKGPGGVGALPAQAQTPQGGLSLQYVLDVALQAHPSLQAARLDMLASGEDQTAAQRQRLPTLSAVVENSSTNTSVISTRVLRLEQNLWDAGRLSARIREAETNVGVNQARVYITAQQLSLQIINAWQNLMASDGRIRVAQDTIARLQGYRDQMQRRVQAEASPPIDLELVNSRMLQTEVELTQAQNSRRVALSRLEQFSGLEGLSRMVLPPVQMPGLSLTEPQHRWLQQVDWIEVANRHPNVQKARQDAIAAQHRIDAKKAEQYPQVYLRVDQPINAVNNDITGFVGLRYTPGAGFSTLAEAQALSTRAASLEQAVDAAVREVTENLFTDRDDFSSSRSRLMALERAVKGSEQVLESYTRQFTASRKSWLDLMNAVRELAQNQYAMADSQAAMTAALYRLQVRMGEPVQPAP